jgi:hypothetical protein
MPSSAYQAFIKNRIDVVRLIANHAQLHSGAPGKKGLGHITRSGVVMLCASWELYAESLLVESLRHLCSKCDSPGQLPLIVQKELAKHVRESSHELKPLALANKGWCDVVIAFAENQCAGLNTPKAGPLNDLFKKFLGLEQLSDTWGCGAQTVNDFVGVRGGIAHRGRDASYVSLHKLKGQLLLIDVVAKETDNAIRAHLKAITPGGRQAWQIIS